ncbi:hypothetical protein K3N28_03355 [Glycomyces sp. TRM65418]|uniref:hypothetical protein n=1 Tax=Glycomyces sp. TRM65418 TaxID=2867006 RepID=UPI001CE62415|nr:hypothetical protein [Glycomyces sp. TRM65418]MCC3762108.1 hypothetical protein [Glycomyces sp. TRM65418]QZD56175.1 hypothetical protein K3N28_03335 [Glycomyces sp. TRM65418]
MRASELIGAPVLDTDGTRCSYVIDLRAGGDDGDLVVDGLVIGRHHWRMFGYEHREEEGPALMRRIIEMLHRHTRYVPWGDFEIDDRAVRLRRDWDDLPPLRSLRE